MEIRFPMKPPSVDSGLEIEAPDSIDPDASGEEEH